MRPAPVDSVLGLVRFSNARTPFPSAETRNPPTPLAATSASSPYIGGQSLSPDPLPPCLQWVTPFLHSWLRGGSRIPGCPSPGKSGFPPQYRSEQAGFTLVTLLTYDRAPGTHAQEVTGCSRASHSVCRGKPGVAGPLDFRRFTRTVLDVGGPSIGAFGMISESRPAVEGRPRGNVKLLRRRSRNGWQQPCCWLRHLWGCFK
jgi:hypothetical protein